MRIVDLFSGAGGLTFGFYYNRENNTFVRNENCNIILRMNMIMRQQNRFVLISRILI